jgi:hypothetical protein
MRQSFFVSDHQTQAFLFPEQAHIYEDQVLLKHFHTRMARIYDNGVRKFIKVLSSTSNFPFIFHISSKMSIPYTAIFWWVTFKTNLIRDIFRYAFLSLSYKNIACVQHCFQPRIIHVDVTLQPLKAVALRPRVMRGTYKQISNYSLCSNFKFYKKFN